MDKMDNGNQIFQAFQHFDLKKEDLNLRILYCNQKLRPVKDRIVTVEASKLPKLPFEDQSFDIALCSNYLCIESDKMDQAFHVNSLLELARVATEVRVYPLMDQEGHPSIHLGPILQVLQEKGFGVELKQVMSDEAEHGNAVLRLWNESCQLS
jgi:hypothetical protein